MSEHGYKNASDSYPIDGATLADLSNRFTYHKPVGDQPARYEKIRAQAHALALHIVGNTPKCREQSLALTKLDEVVFFANAAIARGEPQPMPLPHAASA